MKYLKTCSSLALLLFVALSSLPCDAATYTCVLDKRSGNPTKISHIWTGTLAVDEKKIADADSVAIKASGEGVSLTKLIGSVPESAGKDWKNIAEAKLKPYEGLPVVTLWKSNNRINLINGHSAIKPTEQGAEAFAWASVGTSELGLVNHKSDLQVSCTRK